MKLLIPILLFAAFSTNAQPPTYATARTLFKFSPQHLLENTLKAGIECFDHKQRNSVQLFLSGTWRNKYPVGRNEERLLEGLGAELHYRYYLVPFTSFSSTKQPNAFGFYIGGFGQAARLTDQYTSIYEFRNPDTGDSYIKDFKYEELLRVYGGGITVGVQRTFWKKLVTEFFAGAGYRYTEADIDGERYVPFDCVGCPELKEDEDWRYPALDHTGIFPKVGFNIGFAF
jgi:hypothetical protein